MISPVVRGDRRSIIDGLRSKEPSLKDFTRSIYPFGLLLCRLSKLLNSVSMYSLCFDLTNFLYLLDSKFN